MNETDFDSKARERYRRRGFFGNPDTPKKVILNELAHRLTPSLGDFALMFICGMITGLTIWFDLPPLLLAVFAIFPFLGSFFGFLIGLTTGSFGFAAKAFVNFLITGISFFLGAFLVGYAAGGRFTLDNSFLLNAVQPSSLLLFIAAVSTILALVRLITRQDRLPEKFSTVAFTAAWLPLGLAGFLLGTGAALPFVSALRTSLLALSMNVLVSIIALYALRLFTAKLSAYILSLIFFLFSGFFTFIWRGVIAADAGKIIAAVQSRLSGITVEVQPSVTPASETAQTTVTPNSAIIATESPVRETPTVLDIAGIETLPIESEPHATLEPPKSTADEASAELTVVSVKEKLGIFGNSAASTPDAPTATPTHAPTRTPAPTNTSAPSETVTSKATATSTATAKPTNTAIPSATSLPPTKPFLSTVTPTTTATRTLRPTETATATITEAPPVDYATVKVEGDIGVLVRVSPEFNATVMKSVMNDSPIELTGKRIERPLQNVTWVEVRINDGLTGWVQASHLIFPDESAPTATPTATEASSIGAVLPTTAPTKGYVPTVTPMIPPKKTGTAIPVKAASTATVTSAAAEIQSSATEEKADVQSTETSESAPVAANITKVTVQNPSDVGSLLRLAPEFNSVIMKSLMNGSTLELVGEERKVPYQDFTWVRVRTSEGYVGWVGKNHLVYPDQATAEEKPTSTEETKPVAAATVAPTITAAAVANAPTQVPTQASTATAAQKPQSVTKEPTASTSNLFAVVAATADVGVLVRVSPEKNATVMKSVLNGSMLEIVETTGKMKKPANWVQVRTGDGYVGWVDLDSLIMPNMPTPTVTPTPTPFVNITFGPPVYYAVVHAANESGVYVRSMPQSDAQVENAVLNGSLVELVGVEQSGNLPDSSWVKIRTDGGTVGWVGKDSLIYPEK